MLLRIGVTVPVLRLSLHSCHAGQTGSRQRQVACVISVHNATTRRGYAPLQAHKTTTTFRCLT